MVHALIQTEFNFGSSGLLSEGWQAGSTEVHSNHWCSWGIYLGIVGVQAELLGLQGAIRGDFMEREDMAWWWAQEWKKKERCEFFQNLARCLGMNEKERVVCSRKMHID